MREQVCLQFTGEHLKALLGQRLTVSAIHGRQIGTEGVRIQC